MIVLGMFYLGINTFLLALCGSALKENRFARPTNIEKFKYDVRGCRELAFRPPRHVESVSKLCTSKRTERCLTVEARDTDYNFLMQLEQRVTLFIEKRIRRHSVILVFSFSFSIPNRQPVN